MPLYEYECSGCDRRTEVIQRFADDPLTECSECGGELKRLISAPAVQFKGTGWYVTDYGGRKSSESSSSSKESKEAKESKKPKSETGGDSRASTAEAKVASSGSAD